MGSAAWEGAAAPVSIQVQLANPHRLQPQEIAPLDEQAILHLQRSGKCDFPPFLTRQNTVLAMALLRRVQEQNPAAWLILKVTDRVNAARR